MTVKVLWLGMDVDDLGKYWDCTIVRDLLAGRIWAPGGFPEFHHTNDPEEVHPGSVIVVPGAENRDDPQPVIDAIIRAQPATVFIVKDEASTFPIGRLNGLDARLWVQNPIPDVRNVRGFPVGWTPGVHKVVPGAKTLDWFFAGQHTHARRKKCAKQLEKLPKGELVKTGGFMQGLAYPEYLAKLASCKVAPCPGGVVTPDSFRAWEALELGCIPLADTIGGRGTGQGYWPNMLGETPPFPIIEDWAAAPRLIEAFCETWPQSGNRVQSWWQGWKRRMAYRFYDDLRDVTPSHARPGDRVTVLMPTSSIPSHPSTEIIDETLASIRSRPELSGCEIIIMVDGLREAHEDRRKAYEEYTSRLLAKARTLHNTWVMVFDQPEHQSGMTIEAIKQVRTPAILFVEHDTPLVDEIPVEQLTDAVVSGEADLVRLHHEAMVLDVHMHLMPEGRKTYEIAGVPLVRTIQWSQRPHFANTSYYRQMLEDEFSRTRTKMFIEDRMHGVVQADWRKHGMAGWDKHRLWMYHPEGCIKRSTHLDGRAGEDKVG